MHGCFQVNSKVKQPLSEVNTCLIVLCPIVTEQITTLIRSLGSLLLLSIMNNLLEQNAQNKNMLHCSQWLWSYMILKPGQRGQLTVYLLTKIGLLQL